MSSEREMYYITEWLKEIEETVGKVKSPEDMELQILARNINDLLDAKDVPLTERQYTHTKASVVGYAKMLTTISDDEADTPRYAAAREIVRYLHDIAILQRLDMLLDDA